MRWLGFLLGAAIVAAAWVITSLVTEDREEARGNAAPSERAAAAELTRVPAAAASAEAPIRAAADAQPAEPDLLAKEPLAGEAAADTPPTTFDPESYIDLVSASVRDQLEHDERKDVYRSKINHFIKRIGYMPEQEDLDRIALILIEATRRKDAQVWALFEQRANDPDSLPGEQLAETKYRLVEDYNAELRQRLRPYVRPDVFEEAFDRWCGKWYIDHPDEPREESGD